MWWGHPGFFPFAWLFGWFLFPLLVCLLIFRVFAFRRFGRGCWGGPHGRFEAEAILQRRLASGEIGEADYQRLKDILNK